MKRSILTAAGSALLVAGMALSHVARADFELTAPDGRRILLMDNGTWQLRAKRTDKDQAEGKSSRRARRF